MASLFSKQELHCFLGEEPLQFVSDGGTPMQHKDISLGLTLSTSTLPEFTEEELDTYFHEAVQEEWGNLDKGSDATNSSSTQLKLATEHARQVLKESDQEIRTTNCETI